MQVQSSCIPTAAFQKNLKNLHIMANILQRPDSLPQDYAHAASPISVVMPMLDELLNVPKSPVLSNQNRIMHLPWYGRYLIYPVHTWQTPKSKQPSNRRENWVNSHVNSREPNTTQSA